MTESDRRALQEYRGDVVADEQTDMAISETMLDVQNQTGGLPDVPRTALEEALARFDAELRDTEPWADWERKGNYKYAIVHDGQRYPVKQIVAMATGLPTRSFSGGEEANRYVTDRGLTVMPIHLSDPPSTWWVNQGGSYAQERDGDYLWASLQNKRGLTPKHWKDLERLRAGDIVLHYANTALRAVSQVQDAAVHAPRPAANEADAEGPNGYLVKTTYHEFPAPLPLADIPEAWRQNQAGPFTKLGSINQGYLYPVSIRLVARLVRRFPDRWPTFVVEAVEEIEPEQEGVGRVYKIAPGPDARYWEECLDGGYICVGWDEVGDLRQYPTKAAFLHAFEQQFAEEYNFRAAKITEKANELWTLIDLQPGDRIVANRGTSEVLAVGEVVSPGYEWRSDREAYHHTVWVNWDTLVATSIPKQPSWGMRTIAPVPDELLNLILDRQALDDIYVAPPYVDIVAHIGNQGLRLSERTLRRYHLSLATRGFVILAGPSGTGKTWLAEAYAEAVGARHALVSVAPNWTTNEDLLGYFNPLSGQYHDTAFSRFLRDAARAYTQAFAAGRTPRPYHLVLDELNLARVEYYFAAFLSAMEVRARHGAAMLALGPEETVLLSPNLNVIGTVNIDETTHGFADKVYDRAQLVELDLRREDLALHLGDAVYREELLSIWDAVADVGPFAFRVLDELAAYVAGAEALGVPWTEAVDEQLLQKVLPKLKGADPAIGTALERFTAETVERFPLSHTRAAVMLEGFRQHGFASYFH